MAVEEMPLGGRKKSITHLHMWKGNHKSLIWACKHMYWMTSKIGSFAVLLVVLLVVLLPDFILLNGIIIGIFQKSTTKIDSLALQLFFKKNSKKPTGETGPPWGNQACIRNYSSMEF